MRNFTKPILILLFTHIIFSVKAQSVTTIAQGDWTNPSTWMGGVIPTDANTAIINHAVVVNGVATCKDLTISTSGSLTCSGSDVLTIGNNPIGGNAVLQVDGSLTMNDDCQVFLRGSVVFGADATWTMNKGLFEIDGNNGDVASSVAVGTPLLSLELTTTKNILGGTIRFNDPHAVTGNFLIDGAVDLLATIEVGKGLGITTDTDTPFAFGDGIVFRDVNVNYHKGANNMLSFGMSTIVRGNFSMSDGGLSSSANTKFEGDIICDQLATIEGQLYIGSPTGASTLISGTGNFRAATIQSSTPSTGGNIVLDNNLIITNLILNNSIELNGAILTVLGNISGPGIIIANLDGSALKRTIAAGAGTTVFPIGLSAYDYAPVTISNTSATTNWSVSISSTINKPPTSTKAVQIQWDIKPNIAGTKADINVQWDEANEEAGFNRASSALHHWNGASWDMITPLAGSSTAGTTHSITKTGWNSFSPFAVFSQPSLPVDLISFTGKVQQGKAILSWVTGSEKNNNGFDIEKSFDGENFEKIGFVKSTGNRQITQYYNFLDYNLKQNAYYRLKQVDADGSFNHSKTITLSNEGGKGKSTILAYPNPVKEILTVEANVYETTQLEIVDVVGRVVYKQNVESGNYQISTSDLAKGIYFVKLADKNDITIQKIIKN
jgi:Secretion system C-terminal sorting domain